LDTVDSSLAFSQQVALLEKKRAVLLGLLRLTETLQQLRVALTSVLQLGGAAGAAPSDSDLRAFEVIRQRVAKASRRHGIVPGAMPALDCSRFAVPERKCDEKPNTQLTLW